VVLLLDLFRDFLMFYRKKQRLYLIYDGEENMMIML